MNDETLRALVGSILKWDAIALGCGINRASYNCPLCQLCNCFECPVCMKTGLIDCDGTDYYDIAKYIGKSTLPEIIRDGYPTNETCDRIEKFIEFMVKLLPENFNEKDISWDFFHGIVPSAESQ